LVTVVGALGAVAAAMALGHRLTTVLPAAYVVSIFLVAVLAAAVGFGPWAGLVAAIASFFAFDFFFIEPTFTFAVGDPREVFALGVFLVAAVLIGVLAGRMRVAVDAARRRADTLAMLRDFSERASATTDLDEIRALVAHRAGDRVGGAAVLFDRRAGADGPIEAWPEPVVPTPEEIAAVAALFADPAALPASSGRFEFRPLVTADGVVAVIGLEAAAVAARPGREEGLAALLDQAAVALDRARIAEDRAAATAAAERERLRSALLASISHDLRTPLATILGSATSLRELGDRMAPEDRADLLLAIEEETGRLSRFVGDLLLMTRLEAGLDVRRDRIDVGEVAAAAADHLRRVHPDRAVRLVRAGGAATVRGEATLLEQVLFNLGANAIAASPAGSPIEIEVRDDGVAQIRVTVTDRGRGLAPEELRRLFERGETRTAHPPPEARGGLGLVIARRVVAAMGGTLTAESRTAAVPGTRVTLCLPFAPHLRPVEPEVLDP
jgi:two-component system sensor histidine kinase KdpD